MVHLSTSGPGRHVDAGQHIINTVGWFSSLPVGLRLLSRPVRQSRSLQRSPCGGFSKYDALRRAVRVSSFIRTLVSSDGCYKVKDQLGCALAVRAH